MNPRIANYMGIAAIVLALGKQTFEVPSPDERQPEGENADGEARNVP